jgi:hypothetical protein
MSTGRNLTLTIDGDSYTAQLTNAVLNTAPNQVTVETFEQRNYKTIDNASTLAVDMIQDWAAGAAGLCFNLANAYQSAPDTSLPFVLTLSGITATGNLFPLAPDFGGASLDVLSTSITFVIDGQITYTD